MNVGWEITNWRMLRFFNVGICGIVHKLHSGRCWNRRGEGERRDGERGGWERERNRNEKGVLRSPLSFFCSFNNGGWERGRETGMRGVFSVLRSRFSALLTMGHGGIGEGDGGMKDER
jgi:hypothetical protein